MTRQGSDDSTLRWRQEVSHHMPFKHNPVWVRVRWASCEYFCQGITCLAQRRVSTQNKLMNGSLEAKFGFEIPSVLGYKKDTGHKKQSQSEGRGFCSPVKTYRDLGSCFQSASWVLWFAHRGLLVSHWIETSESPRW